MALTATFAADMSGFIKSLEDAQVHLRVIDRETARASASVTRELEGISGQRVAAEAAKMAEAIRRLGGEGGTAAGLLKLTDDELRRVQRTIAEATEKAARMGEALPSALRQVGDEIAKLPAPTTQAARGLGVLDATFGRLTAAFSVATLIDRALTGIVSIGTAAVDSAGELVDLNASTNVSIETLQRWGQVAKLGGLQLEDMTGASFRLSTAIAGSGQSVRESVGRLGLEFERLRSLKPEDQMDTILRAAEALGPSQERNAVLVELFGNKGAQALARIVDGYREAADAANVAGADQIRAIDAAADRWDKFVDDTMTRAKAALGTVLKNIQEGPGTPLTGPNGEYIVSLADLALQSDAVAAATAAATQQAEADAEARRLQTAASRDYVAELANLQAKLAELTPSQREQLDAAVKLGASTEDIANRFKLSEEAQRLYGATTKETAKDLEQGAEAAKAYAASLKAIGGASALADASKAMRQLQDVGGVLRVLPSQLDGLRRRFEAGAEAARTLGDSELAEFYAGVARELTPVAQLQDRYNVTVGQYVTASDDYTRAVIDQYDAMNDLSTIYIGILPNLMDLTNAMEGLREPLAPTDVDQFGQAFESAIADLGVTFVTVMTDASRDAGERMQAIMSAAVQGITAAAGNIIGGAFGGPAGAAIGTQIGGVIGRAFSNALTVETERAIVAMDQRVRTAADDILRGSDRFKPDVDTSALDASREWLAASNDIINASRQQFDAWQNIADAVKSAQREIDELNKVEERGRGAEWTREMQKAQEDLTAALTAQHGASETARAELENLGAIALGTFGAAIESGMSFGEAIRAAGPGLTQLLQSYENLGTRAENAGVRALMAFANAPELLAGIDGLTKGMAGLSSMGLLNADTFKQMQEAGSRMFARIQGELAAQGVDMSTNLQALMPMQDYLREAARQAEALGIPLDANTQMLIDQSKELGIWKDKGKPPMEEMRDVMIEVRDVLREFVDDLRGIPRNVDTTITTRYRQDGSPTTDPNAPRNTAQPAGLGPSPTATAASTASRGSDRPIIVNARFEVDGRTLAEATVPYIPDALDRAGV